MTARILVYRLGSLGDTVVALPCFHLLRRLFPEAELRVLTNLPISDNAPRLSSVLGDSGLVDGYFEYPVRPNVGTLWRLAQSIRAWGPERVVYIGSRNHLALVLRDAAFFLACGIKKLDGLPMRRDLLNRRNLPNGFEERECERLARCLAKLGDADIHNRANWDLRLTDDEMATAKRIVAEQIGPFPFIAFSVGTKKPGYDWGQENWQYFIEKLVARTSYRFVFVGAESDRKLSDTLGHVSPERFSNLCGRLEVRESAAMLAQAVLFVGHDSGPMHLASAVGIPLVAIFSNQNAPGAWFPLGDMVRILYPQEVGSEIRSIKPEEALTTVARLLAVSDETVKTTTSKLAGGGK